MSTSVPDGGVAEDFLHVAGLVQVSVGNGTMRPFLLVGIENTERRRDMTGPTENENDRKIAPRVGGCAPRLQIFSRWGQQVYEDAAYRNTWDGTGLPAGIYYYLLTPADGAPPIKGWVEMVK